MINVSSRTDNMNEALGYFQEMKEKYVFFSSFLFFSFLFFSFLFFSFLFSSLLSFVLIFIFFF